ncbi:hypothetical protein [Amycolatopsis sp. cmx-4-68]|uniref:hypothetical protein n=1 Tax=Amycolatopsis sp. cmx-4-68 TaxID=2790938 RepID=UPI00397E209C
MTAARALADPVAFDDALLDVLGAGHHPRLPGPSQRAVDVLCAWRDAVCRGHHPAALPLATTGRTS